MKNIKILSTVLEKRAEKLSSKDKLANYNWDSMAKINLISLLNSKYKKNINLKKMQSAKTIGDLDRLIEITLNKNE